MKYDDAEFYFIDFTTDLPQEAAGRHIATFLDWAIRRGLASEVLMAYRPGLLAGEVDALSVLFDECDGKLLDTDLNEEGNAFAREAYARWSLHDFSLGKPADASLDEVFGVEHTPQRHARLLRLWDVHYADWLRPIDAPGLATMLERLLASAQPVIEAAGFRCIGSGDKGYDRHGVIARYALFERTLQNGCLRVELVAKDAAASFRGIELTALAHDGTLHEAIQAEKRLDDVSSSITMDYAVIPPRRIADGWDDAMNGVVAVEPGFWVFRTAQLDPLVAWITARLRTFVLPTLRGIEGIDGLALAYHTPPGTPSPIRDPRDPYPMLLAAEQARHPQLATLLDATEADIRARGYEQRSWEEDASLKLIARIRHRTPRV